MIEGRDWGSEALEGPLYDSLFNGDRLHSAWPSFRDLRDLFVVVPGEAAPILLRRF